MHLFMEAKRRRGDVLFYHIPSYFLETQFGIEPGASWEPASHCDPHVILMLPPLTVLGLQAVTSVAQEAFCIKHEY